MCVVWLMVALVFRGAAELLVCRKALPMERQCASTLGVANTR